MSLFCINVAHLTKPQIDHIWVGRYCNRGTWKFIFRENYDFASPKPEIVINRDDGNEFSKIVNISTRN